MALFRTGAYAFLCVSKTTILVHPKLTPEVHTAVLLLGGNIGDRFAHLTAGVKGLAGHCGTITRQSAVYESEVWGGTDQEAYLNLAVVLETPLSPEALLEGCQRIEAAQGRERIRKWDARTLDIDILFFDDAVMDLPHLKIPHPLLSERRFVLQPLSEILPLFRHPQKGKSIQELLLACPDTGNVWPWGESTSV